MLDFNAMTLEELCQGVFNYYNQVGHELAQALEFLESYKRQFGFTPQQTVQKRRVQDLAVALHEKVSAASICRSQFWSHALQAQHAIAEKQRLIDLYAEVAELQQANVMLIRSTQNPAR
jgi:methylphosphotriester-DNA--protein-cysteine methyltransferase